MSINPSEITKLLKDQIKNFGEKAEVSEIGKVLSVGDGIARVYGLDNVQAGEMVEFEDGSKTERIEVAYPVGHRERRKEGIPILKEKSRYLWRFSFRRKTLYFR